MANYTKILLLPRLAVDWKFNNTLRGTTCNCCFSTACSCWEFASEHLLMAWDTGLHLSGPASFPQVKKLFLNKGIKHTAMQAKTFWHEIPKMKNMGRSSSQQFGWGNSKKQVVQAGCRGFGAFCCIRAAPRLIELSSEFPTAFTCRPPLVTSS